MSDQAKLHCVVCTSELPSDRRYSRARNPRTTCSDECRDTLREIRREIDKTKQCRSCGRPIGAAEQAQYRAWRRDQAKADGRQRGRPPVKRVVLLETVLNEAVALLRSGADGMMADNWLGKLNWIEAVEAKLPELQIILDAKAQSGSTLAPCGQATESTEAVQGER